MFNGVVFFLILNLFLGFYAAHRMFLYEHKRNKELRAKYERLSTTGFGMSFVCTASWFVDIQATISPLYTKIIFWLWIATIYLVAIGAFAGLKSKKKELHSLTGEYNEIKIMYPTFYFTAYAIALGLNYVCGLIL